MQPRDFDAFVEQMASNEKAIFDAIDRPDRWRSLDVIRFPVTAFSGPLPAIAGPVDFGATSFTVADFADRTIHGATFAGATFTRSQFGATEFRGSQFVNVQFVDCDFVGTDLAAGFERATFVDCRFETARFGGATLDDVTFERCRFDRVFMYDIDFSAVSVVEPVVIGPVFGARDSGLFDSSDHDPTQDWIEPTPTNADDAAPLTDDHVDAWRRSGACLVDGLLPPELIDQVRADAQRFYPAPGSPEAAAINDFGSGNEFVFPAQSEAVNAVTLHVRLLAAVGQLLGVPIEELRLSQSDLWVKYGRERSNAGRSVGDNNDQRIHVDYPNHTLVHPPAWDAPEAVELIVYYDDVADTGGATALVPRSGDDDPAYLWPIVGTPGVGELPWINDRASAEEYLSEHAPDVAAWRREHLYPREKFARFSPGSVLLYRHDTWHRGTPLLSGAMRIAHNLTFRRADAEWISSLHPGWAWAMYLRDQRMERLIGTASVAQRCVLGFPAPGHRYWTPQTLAAVTARYLAFGFDPAPYASAIA